MLAAAAAMPAGVACRCPPYTTVWWLGQVINGEWPPGSWGQWGTGGTGNRQSVSGPRWQWACGVGERATQISVYVYVGRRSVNGVGVAGNANK